MNEVLNNWNCSCYCVKTGKEFPKAASGKLKLIGLLGVAVGVGWLDWPCFLYL